MKEIYIYGAAVQGIQSFIFRTNELKDIVGASELVEHICTKFFKDEFLQNGEALITAAGNIKCKYSNEEECKKTVRLFPKKVMEKAPGITISQAVVKCTEDELQNDFQKLMNQLEGKLHAQRNKQAKSMTLGLMSLERSRKTGLPAIRRNNDEYIDEATLKKRELSEGAKATIKLCEKSFGQEHVSPRNIALNIGELTDKNDWIAIIHADGNGLGEVVQRKASTKEGLKDFSQNLDHATIDAARAAFRAACTSIGSNEKYPFRPVVLGGDDMTVICKASLALPYVKEYIKNFEEKTKEYLGYKLTACAGIAYIKSAYPFHYGYSLAEILCSQAKKVSKSPSVSKGAASAPSSIMFYKVQSSFIESYDLLIEKEKTPQDGMQLSAGPYFLNDTEGYWTIDKLQEVVGLLTGKEGNTAKTAIRKWMTFMHQNIEMAEQSCKRSKEILRGKMAEVFREATNSICRLGTKFYPAGDIIDLFTIQNQITKED